MSNQYETVFIMTPVLSEDQMKETVSKFKKMLAEKGAEIIYQHNWGLRKLAYPIQKKSTGFYYLIEFKAEGNTVRDIEINYKRDERILRFLTVKLDKYAIIYNARKHSEKEKAKPEKEKTEAETK